MAGKIWNNIKEDQEQKKNYSFFFLENLDMVDSENLKKQEAGTPGEVNKCSVNLMHFHSLVCGSQPHPTRHDIIQDVYLLCVLI